MASRISLCGLFPATPRASFTGTNILVDVFDNVQTALKESKDLLSLAPVPGLSAAVGVLLAIVDQVKKMKSNRETAEEISKEIKKLNDIIYQVIRRVADRAVHLEMSPEERGKMWDDLQASDGWQERVVQLVNDLQDLLGKAQPCAEGPWHKRLFRSTRDEETLKTIRDDLARMLQTYQLAGTLSIEAMTEQSLGRLETVYVDVKRIAAAQTAQHEQKIIDILPHTDAADYKAASNVDKSLYLPGTRDAVWRRIEEWKSSDKPVCFIVGAAGMGKSTLASEFCRRHEDDIGASFFFRRRDPGVGSTVLFFSTIAYQLAQSRPELRSYIATAAEKHIQGGRSQQMQYTVAALLQKPLDEAKAAGVLRRIYVVVDALDECDDSDGASQPGLVPECLRLLLTWALKHPSSLRVLITSRPHPDYVGRALRHGDFGVMLKDSSIYLSLYDVEERQDIDRDIGKIIHEALCKVPEAVQWHQRDPTIVTRLTEQSQGVFVYARTAAVFIISSEGVAEMQHRFQLLTTPGNTWGLGRLDLLYRTVLETAFPPADLDPRTQERLRLILAWIALCQAYQGICPDDVEELSGISCGESISILTKLRSVLVFDPGAEDVNQKEFRAMHVTFRDFLDDPTRCGSNYHVDIGQMHARLATHCLHRMHNRLVGVHDRMRGHFIENHYAACCWSNHVVAADPTKDVANLLEEIFNSITTDRPSLLFAAMQFRWDIFVDMENLLRWVDLHIGRDFAKIIGEQHRLEDPEVTIRYGEKITVTKLPPGSPGAPTKQEVKELRKRRQSQLRHSLKCWAKNYPADAFYWRYGLSRSVDPESDDDTASHGDSGLS